MFYVAEEAFLCQLTMKMASQQPRGNTPKEGDRKFVFLQGEPPEHVAAPVPTSQTLLVELKGAKTFGREKGKEILYPRQRRFAFQLLLTEVGVDVDACWVMLWRAAAIV